jgi:hypothetical protein
MSEWHYPSRTKRDWDMRGYQSPMPSACHMRVGGTEAPKPPGFQSPSLLTAHPRAEGVPKSEVSGARLSDEPENGLYSLLFNGQAFRTSRLKRAYGRRGYQSPTRSRDFDPGWGYQSPNLQPPSESQPWLEEYPINTWTYGKTTHHWIEPRGNWSARQYRPRKVSHLGPVEGSPSR